MLLRYTKIKCLHIRVLISRYCTHPHGERNTHALSLNKQHEGEAQMLLRENMIFDQDSTTDHEGH